MAEHKPLKDEDPAGMPTTADQRAKKLQELKESLGELPQEKRIKAIHKGIENVKSHFNEASSAYALMLREAALSTLKDLLRPVAMYECATCPREDNLRYHAFDLFWWPGCPCLSMGWYCFGCINETCIEEVKVVLLEERNSLFNYFCSLKNPNEG